MRMKVLALINCVLAVALTYFIYTMLPYARGAACGIPKPGISCPPISTIELFLGTMAPVVFISVFIFAAFGIRSAHPRVSTTLMLAPAAAVICWVTIAWIAATP